MKKLYLNDGKQNMLLTHQREGEDEKRLIARGLTMLYPYGIYPHQVDYLDYSIDEQERLWVDFGHDEMTFMIREVGDDY